MAIDLMGEKGEGNLVMVARGVICGVEMWQKRHTGLLYMLKLTVATR